MRKSGGRVKREARLPGGTRPLWSDTAILNRRSSPMSRLSHPIVPQALFLDRDGTVIEDRHYLCDPDGVALLPGVAKP